MGYLFPLIFLLLGLGFRVVSADVEDLEPLHVRIAVQGLDEQLPGSGLPEIDVLQSIPGRDLQCHLYTTSSFVCARS